MDVVAGNSEELIALRAVSMCTCLLISGDLVMSADLLVMNA